MEILKTLLASDPSTPRLTYYDETTGGRIDLSANTLDNWASKIANMLHDEFDLEPGDSVWVDLPPTWQVACIVLGCERAGVVIDDSDPLVVFTSVGRLSHWEETVPDAYLAAVTDDVFGRGVVECGGEIPPGVIDFGPEVRLHPDAYLGTGPLAGASSLFASTSAQELEEAARSVVKQEHLEPKARVLATGWGEGESLSGQWWACNVLASWLVDGSAVIVRGGNSDRLNIIFANEKVSVALHSRA